MMRARSALLAAAILVAASGLASCTLQKIVVEPVTFALVKDGTYRGLQETTLVTAEVEATMSGGVLRTLSILRHECGLGKPAEAITGRILQAQSLEVDAIAGATYSSSVILKATETALRKGL
jgi:uncharacterized protein with FMN-binding domain